jgi:hypothetical protein
LDHWSIDLVNSPNEIHNEATGNLASRNVSVFVSMYDCAAKSTNGLGDLDRRPRASGCCEQGTIDIGRSQIISRYGLKPTAAADHQADHQETSRSNDKLGGRFSMFAGSIHSASALAGSHFAHSNLRKEV